MRSPIDNQNDAHGPGKIPLGRNNEHDKLPDWKDNDIFRATFCRAGIGMAVVDLSGRIMDSNPALQHMLGYEAGELEGMAFPQITHPDDVQIDSELAQELFSCKRETYCLEKRYIRKDGGLIWGKLTVSLVLTQDGTPRFGIGMVEDITKAKQTEASLKESQRRMSTLMSNLPGMAYRCKNDPQWTMEFVSHGCYPLTGYKSDALIDNAVLSYGELIHPEDRQMVYDEIQEALDARRTFQIAYRMKTENGLEKWVWEMGQGITGTEGSIVAIEGFIVDITEQQRTKNELVEKEKHFRQLTEMLPEAVFETDPEMNITFANQAAYAMFGFDREDFERGLNAFDMIMPEERTVAADIIDKQAGFQETTIIEYRCIKKDGSVFPALVRTSPIEEQDSVVGFRGVVVDITEQKKLEERLRIAQKMESLGNLSGGIAHDFNNILFPIVGLSEMLMEDLPPNSHARESAEEIYKAGKRGSDLVKQILAFSRKAEPKKIPIRIQQIVKEVLRLSRSTIPVNISIAQDIQSDCSRVQADPTQIHQILMNLITNAYHAVAPKSGAITVRLNEVEIGFGQLPGSNLLPGKYALMSVSDTGTGIEPAILHQIFDPYFTTKAQGKGTGLGLAVVYGIVKEHQGDIRVTSELGNGTTFNVYLPIMAQAESMSTVEQNADAPVGHEHILLVDDEVAIAKLEKQLLERLGYTVTMRVNSLETLEAFKNKPGIFDLVISDITMPQMTGDRLARELISIRPDIPIIMCTGFSERLDAKKAESIGVKGFLMKPIVKSELAKTVRKVLDEAKSENQGCLSGA